MDTATQPVTDIQAPGTGTYVIDPVHSSISFGVRHLMSKVRGRIRNFSGQIVVGESPTDSSVEATLEAASISTDNDMRDQHLRGEDFFNIDKYPEWKFVSTGLVPKTATEGELTGELTIREVTKPIKIKAEYLGTTADMQGNQRIFFSAATEINREDFSVNWNAAMEAGGLMIGKEVKIEIEVQAVKQ